MDRKIFADATAELVFKPLAGDRWHPADLSEQYLFDHLWCCHCIKYSFCLIKQATLHIDITDENYPKEMRISTEGQPECSDFEENKSGFEACAND